MANGEYAGDFVKVADSFQVTDCDSQPGALRDCNDEEKTKW